MRYGPPAYDTLNRVSSAQGGSRWGATFSYDGFGNLTQTGSVSGTVIHAMNVNQQVNTSNQFTQNGYGYDAAGNVLRDGTNPNNCSTNGTPTTYNWNAEEQLACGPGASYTYDGDGERVKKSSGTLYWGAGAALAESDLSGNLTSESIFFNGKRIARRDVPTGNVYYYISDQLGSSNVVVNSAGVIQNESDYYPFGGEYVLSSALPNQHYKFTGKERDTESGNDYFGARYYASSMGRFVSPDWSAKVEPVPYSKLDDPQTLNLYSYVQNNPLIRADADGHCWPLCTILAGAAAGAAASGAIEFGAQLIKNGGDVSKTQWNKVGNAALGGMVTGAMMGLAGPEGGVALKVGVSVVAAVSGGAVEKTVNGEKITASGVAVDAVVGASGHKIEKIAEKAFATKTVQKGLPKVVDKLTDAARRINDKANEKKETK